MRRLTLMSVLDVFGIGYSRYQIYECPVPPPTIVGHERVYDITAARLADACKELRLTGYGGSEARGFGLDVNGELASVCWYWFGARYQNERGFISLPPGAAKLVQIVTAQTFRGRGLAPILIAGSAQAMYRDGFRPLFARVWHTNQASRAAFRKARWIEQDMITTISLPLISTPYRWRRSSRA
jgi:hypothetical protein